MSTLKKILSLSLALAMLMSVSVFAGFADAAEIDKDAKAAVELLAAVKILNGIPQEDGTVDFAPKATIKRAEAAKMIYVLRNGGVDDGAATWKAAVSFADCEGHWAAGYIAYCETYGIINGRTETVFDPEAPVTGIELAKMLLTVAGYKGEVEGYTGTGWEKNVVADANEAGLFDGAKFALTEAAPRQWAAVMFENAFDVNIPVYIGDYRVDGIVGTQLTVAEKFLDFNADRVTTVLATETASVNGTFAAKGKVILADGTETFAVADALVGQQVKVTTINDKIVTIAATGKTIAGELKVGAKITSGTDKDKYPVTVGGTAIGNKATTDVIFDTLTVQNVLDQQAKKGNYVAYTAYDADGNKTVDYITTATTTYGVVTVNTDKSFTVGSFAVDKDGKTTVGSAKVAVTVAGTMKTGIVAKYTVDTLTGKYSVAPADVAVGVFTGISGTKYTVGGTQYEYATDALESAYLAAYTNMKKTVVLYTDGKYVVKAEEFTTETVAPTTPTALPAQLAYLIDGAKVAIAGTNVDEWGNETPAATKYAYKVKVMLANGATAMFELETDAKALKDIACWTTANLFFAEGGFDTSFAGAVYEYALSANGKLILKKGFADVDKVDFYVNGEKAQTVEANKAMGLAKDYNTTNTLFGDTFIRGTENTVVFAKYTDKDGKVSYKTIKLADLKGTTYSTKVLAATADTIGEALLVVAEYAYKAPTTTPVTTTPYIVAVSAPEYIVEGDKIFKTFKAIDLNKAGDAVEYKADAATALTITKGSIYKLETKDGLVTKAEAETWAEGSVQAKVADLLLVKYAGASDASLVEIKGTNAKNYFADNCKIIVKNGDAYTAGNVDSLIVAKKTDNVFNNNIKYVLDTNNEFTYIIIDLAK